MTKDEHQEGAEHRKSTLAANKQWKRYGAVNHQALLRVEMFHTAIRIRLSVAPIAEQRDKQIKDVSPHLLALKSNLFSCSKLAVKCDWQVIKARATHVIDVLVEHCRSPLNRAQL